MRILLIFLISLNANAVYRSRAHLNAPCETKRISYIRKELCEKMEGDCYEVPRGFRCEYYVQDTLLVNGRPVLRWIPDQVKKAAYDAKIAAKAQARANGKAAAARLNAVDPNSISDPVLKDLLLWLQGRM